MRSRTMTSIDSYQHTHAARYVPISLSKQVGINSKIILPLVNEYMSLNHQIKWYRCYGSRSQYLPHIDNCKTYQCSPLDFNCKIQAIVEYPLGFKCSKSSLPYEIRIVKPQRSSVKEKYQYQVVLLNQNLTFKPEAYQGVRIAIKVVFDLIYQTIKQASLYIQDKIFIKARQNYELSLEQILSIYVSNLSSLQITIPAITQDKFHKKIFAEKQPHRYRSIPAKLSFCNYQAFGSALLLINKLKTTTSLHNQKLSSSRFQKPEVYLSFLGDKPSNEGYKKYMNHLFSKPSNISTDILNITSPSYSQNPQIMSMRITPNQPFKALNNINSYNLKGSELIQRTIYKNSNIVSSEKDNIGTDENSFNFMEDFDELFQDQKQERQLCLNSSFDELDKKNEPFEDMRIIRQIQDRKKQQNNKVAQSKKIFIRMKQTQEEINKLQSCNEKLKREIEIMKNLQKQPHITINQLHAMVNSMKRYELKLKKQISLGKEQKQSNQKINIFEQKNFQLQIEAKQ